MVRPPPGRAVRAQPEPLRPAGRAGAGQVGRLHPLRGAGPGPLPGHHRGALHDHPAALRVPLVRPRARGAGRSRNDDRARPGAAHAGRGVAGAAPGRAGRGRSPSCAPRCCGRGGPGCSTSWPRWGSAGPTSWSGLRGVADEPHFLRAGEEAALGLLDDDDGLAVCTDALRDAQLAPLLLATVRGVATASGTGGRPARRRRRHGDRLRRPGRPDGLPVADRRAAARRRPDGRPGRGRLQPRGGAAGALGLGGARPRRGAGAAGRPLRRVGPGAHLAAGLLRLGRVARGGRRRLRGRGAGAGHHDGRGCTWPSTAPSCATTSRWWTGSTRRRRRSRRRTRRCWRRRASPTWSSGSASPAAGSR